MLPTKSGALTWVSRVEFRGWGDCKLPSLSVYMHVFPLRKRVHRYDQTQISAPQLTHLLPIPRIPSAANAAVYIVAKSCGNSVCQNQGSTLKVGVEFDLGTA